jgi:hypothetical protein
MPKMEVLDGRSSSNDLSSAPPSDSEHTPGPHYLSSHHEPNTADNLRLAHDLNGRLSHTNPIAGVSATAAGPRQVESTPPVKRVRKKKEPDDPNAPPKEKKPRGPRRPKAPAGSGTLAAAPSRKKTKVEQTDDKSTIHIPGHSNTALQSSTLVQPVLFAQRSPTAPRHDVAKTAESSFTIHDRPIHSYASPPPSRAYDYPKNISAAPQPPPPTATPRSTAMYDPIRGSVMQRPLDPSPSIPPTNITPPRPMYNPNPSTSPAISGIINPQPEYSPPTTIVTHHPKPDESYSTNGRYNLEPPRVNEQSIAMDIEPTETESSLHKKAPSSRKVPSEASTRATSPKPARAKEQPPPPPMGSGLLSASLFGGDTSNEMQKDSEKGPNIILRVDLKDPNNRVINFARMAEEKYGFAALYPRLAAQKERLAKVAAAGAALERSTSGSKLGGTPAGDSGDEDLSVDIDRDSENDRDVEMSGVNGGQEQASGTDGPGPKRRRRKKVEEYDQEDDFIDDSEMLWEAQAAAVKDGFFVYCGPLVPEGEKPAVERYAALPSISYCLY